MRETTLGVPPSLGAPGAEIQDGSDEWVPGIQGNYAIHRTIFQGEFL